MFLENVEEFCVLRVWFVRKTSCIVPSVMWTVHNGLALPVKLFHESCGHFAGKGRGQVRELVILSLSAGWK
jgi:hypothetical protein